MVEIPSGDLILGVGGEGGGEIYENCGRYWLFDGLRVIRFRLRFERGNSPGSEMIAKGHERAFGRGWMMGLRT